MSIIMVDCEDCYARAKKFEELSKQYEEYARQLGDDGAELTTELQNYSELFASLAIDIRKATDIWTDFYTHNVRTD